MKAIIPITFFFFIVLTSCKNSIEHKTFKDWTTIRITNDWLIDVPLGYKRQEFPGIDSEVGSIFSKKDSINIEFESYNDIIGEGDLCDTEKQNKRINQEIKSLETKYSINDYEFIIEKINGHLALIVYPKDFRGDYYLKINNCEIDRTIVIEGIGMKDKRKILEIFRSLRSNKEQ